MAEKYLYVHKVLKRTLLLRNSLIAYRNHYEDSWISLFGFTMSTGRMCATQYR
jgi:hypothetical protein